MSDLPGESEPHHRDRGNSDRPAAQARAPCEEVVTGGGAFGSATWSPLRPGNHSRRKAGGTSAQTFHHDTAAPKTFGNWPVAPDGLPRTRTTWFTGRSGTSSGR